MFENILAKLPAEAPRSLAVLPGLRLRSLLPPFLLLPLIFAAFFLVMIMTIPQNETLYRLRQGKTAEAQGRIETVAGCERRAGTIRYVFSAADGRQYRSTEATRTPSVPGSTPLQQGDTCRFGILPPIPP